VGYVFAESKIGKYSKGLEMRVLVLGATGMLGYAAYVGFSGDERFQVFGTLRAESGKKYFHDSLASGLFAGVDFSSSDSIVRVFTQVKPDLVINCVGVIKQQEDAENPLHVLPVNSMLPHRLAELCALAGARLVHISTDCVFSGDRGGYSETDESDAKDLYGKSKFIGEVTTMPHVVTLRTSIIGHELQSRNGLVEWFLSQNNAIKGFTKAIFSGVPVNHLSWIIKEYVAPDASLSGLYQVSADPISKYDLLSVIAKQYGKKVSIEPYDQFVIDRSLDSSLFRKKTGYAPPEWSALIEDMYRYYNSIKGVKNV
jgi:dTDP-4-dehydrorhamnose reductase|tara:strand:- start:5605 stop:6543 length:939 start_codon:yes stop_codon:yes gene_type:complete